jgi:NADPH-dependent 2,4-dienoyl-CoA reductase/sulfur reductase-like enzyme/Fe-S-cluster-containing hydrogenase component 2
MDTGTMMKRIREVELLVVGAGLAGLGAAIEASRYGAKVLLVDDKDKPGGQLFKQIHKFFGSKEHLAGIRGFDIGLHLLKEADSQGVEISLQTKVLGIIEKDIISLLIKEREMKLLKAKRIVLATGGIEKALSFPGWTLPGVMSAGAAQTLINIERVLPGERILMVGSGNVGLIVSYQLLQAGADVVGIVEAAPSITGYLVHAGKVMRAGIPIYTSYTIKEARGRKSVEESVIVALDKKWNPIEGTEKTVPADTVCISVGLNPNGQLASLAGCEFKFFPELGGFLPLHNDNMESTKKGIYIAGDLSGIEEANSALDEGRLAGISVASSLGYIDNNKFVKLKEEYWSRLNGLRKGPFGAKRAIAKKGIISSFQQKEIVHQERDNKKLKENTKLKNYRSIPSLKEFQEFPGYPSLSRIKKGVVACIECIQEVPCDPCVTACPFKAISISPHITNLPYLDENKCKGCGACIASCPGQAIFVLNYNYSSEKAAISFPYEYLPYPKVGGRFMGVGRKGESVAEVEIVKVDKRANFDKTAVITIVCDKEYIHQIRSIERIKDDV